MRKFVLCAVERKRSRVERQAVQNVFWALMSQVGERTGRVLEHCMTSTLKGMLLAGKRLPHSYMKLRACVRERACVYGRERVCVFVCGCVRDGVCSVCVKDVESVCWNACKTRVGTN